MHLHYTTHSPIQFLTAGKYTAQPIPTGQGFSQASTSLTSAYTASTLPKNALDLLRSGSTASVHPD